MFLHPRLGRHNQAVGQRCETDIALALPAALEGDRSDDGAKLTEQSEGQSRRSDDLPSKGKIEVPQVSHLGVFEGDHVVVPEINLHIAPLLAHVARF
jgi:hypothetical protein